MSCGGENLREQTERVCLAFLKSDIALGFTFLHLAEAQSRIARGAHPIEFIEKAILAYKSVMAQLDSTPLELTDEGELREGAGQLFDAIVTVEREMRSSLLTARRTS